MAEPWRHGGVFDGVAEAYDTHRSGYPREIVAAAVEVAGLEHGARVVEVGSGTGKLTEELVASRLRVDAVEPGSNMIELARRRVNNSDLVRFHLGRFEDVSLPVAGFAAVFSGSAFHWVDPSVSWAKAAALLRPGRTLALLQPIGVRDEADGTAVDELEEAFARLAPEIAVESPRYATSPRFARVWRRDARTCRRSGPGLPIPASQYRRPGTCSGRQRSPPSPESNSRQLGSSGPGSRQPRSSTVSPREFGRLCKPKTSESSIAPAARCASPSSSHSSRHRRKVRGENFTLASKLDRDSLSMGRGGANPRAVPQCPAASPILRRHQPEPVPVQ